MISYNLSNLIYVFRGSKISSWRHSQVDRMLENPVSAVILEWTAFDVTFCVIFFRVCSLSHVTSRCVTRWIPSAQACPSITCAHCPGGSSLCAGEWERRSQGGEGGAEEAEWRAAWRGGSQTTQETREDPQVHRHTNTNKVTAWFSLWGQNSHEIFKQLCFPQNQILTICVIICCQERNLNNFICFILSHRVTSTNIHVLGQNKYSIFSLLHFSIFYHSDLKHSQRLQPVVFWLLIHLPVISYFYFIFSPLLLLLCGLKYLANYYSITKMFSDYFFGSPVILFQL